MAKEGFYLLAALWFSFWLLLSCFYFDIPRVNVIAPSHFQSTKTPNPEGSAAWRPPDNTPTTATSITNQGSNQEGSSPAPGPFVVASRNAEYMSDPCAGRHIYIHDLPPRFNEAILEDCEHLIQWPSMCRYLENDGFGPQLDNAQGVFSHNGWYDTHQFSLEVIFHYKMNHYDCLTRNSSLADAIYVPFYAGFDVSRHLYNHSILVRDALSNELVNWLKNTPEWRIMGGKDHFMVAGRITWEFRRLTENDSDWGNKLLLLPEIRNMSTLLIESSPWHSYDFAIPYPTYFHPSNDVEVFFWQNQIRKLKREFLFSFVGAPRPGNPTSIRNNVLNQCKHSKVCKLLECVGKGKICNWPSSIMGLFQSSVFCLQPPGDSPTRKSTFDAILVGCIPVFFHPASAYVQYIWYLPKDYAKYSVFIWENDIRQKNVSIEEILRQISPQRIEEMREEVIDLIPRIIYADPRSKLRTFKDAFDVAVDAVIQRVTKLRRMKYSGGDAQHEEVASHDWDSFLKL